MYLLVFLKANLELCAVKKYFKEISGIWSVYTPVTPRRHTVQSCTVERTVFVCAKLGCQVPGTFLILTVRPASFLVTFVLLHSGT